MDDKVIKYVKSIRNQMNNEYLNFSIICYETFENNIYIVKVMISEGIYLHIKFRVLMDKCYLCKYEEMKKLEDEIIYF